MTTVLWDVDGTLVEPAQGFVSLWPLAVAALGMTPQRPLLPQGLTDRARAAAWLRASGGEANWVDQLLRELDRISVQRLTECPMSPRPDAVDVLAELAQRGIEQGVLTGNTPQRVEVKLRSAGIGTSWANPKLVFTGEAATDRAEVAAHARAVIGPRQLVIVGDTLEDLRAAQSAGADFVAVVFGDGDSWPPEVNPVRRLRGVAERVCGARTEVGRHDPDK